MKKTTLSESFYTFDYIPKISKIDFDTIKNHIIKNSNNTITDNILDYKHQYYPYNYHQHLGWALTYMSEVYQLDHNNYPVSIEYKNAFLIQKKGESIEKHNHLIEWDLKDSPNISVLLTVASGKKPSYLVFDFDNNRDQGRRWKIPLEVGKFIFFSSGLNHLITKNENDEELINVSYQCHFY